MLGRLLAALAVVCAGVAGRAAAAPPLSAFGAPPVVEHMTLSPDGKAFAFVAVDGGKRRVFVRTVDGALLHSIDLGDAKDRSLIWAGDDHLLVFMGKTLHQHAVNGYQYEMMSAISLNLLSGGYVELLSDQHVSYGNVLGYYGGAAQGGRYVVDLLSQDAGGVRLFQVDADSGEGHIVADVDTHAQNWALDGRGQVAARSAYDWEAKTWSLYAGPHNDHPIFTRPSPTDDLRLLGLGASPGTALVDDQSGDQDELLEVPLTGDAAPKPLFEGFNVTGEVFARDSRLLLGATDEQRGRVSLFDPLLQSRFEAARKPFAKYRVSLTSYDDAFDRMILYVEGGDEAGTYWYVDVAAGKALALAQAYPGVAPAEVGPTSLVRYKAADGLEIEAVLTLPPGAKADRLPLVVLPHEGPIGVADGLGFDWWAQAFASRGYAVLQPNYRGSGGYGAAFRRAGYGEWGRKMQTDLSDGVAYLAARGIADPKRVCIVGASYGGYAALAGVTLQHGLYRCAVSYAGVSDLGSTLWRVGHNRSSSVAVRSEERAMGAAWSGDETLRARSPLHQAEKADAPILLIHGKDDTVVPISESEAMDAALTAAGKPHVFLKLDGEDHWLSTPRTRMQMLQASVDFVMRQNPPT